jgi:hypothetical protein
LVVQLGVHEVDLPEVGLGRVAPGAGPMLDRGTPMCVAVDPLSRQQPNVLLVLLAECVTPAPTDCGHDRPDSIRPDVATGHGNHAIQRAMSVVAEGVSLMSGWLR